MRQEYGLEPTVMYYTRMVHLLGQARHLEDAKRFIQNMPLKLDGTTLGALLAACTTYGNVELGEIATKERLKLEPKNASTYMLFSNIFAAPGKREEVSSEYYDAGEQYMQLIKA